MFFNHFIKRRDGHRNGSSTRILKTVAGKLELKTPQNIKIMAIN